MTGTANAPTRRMGPAGSENWHAMLDGAEAILRDEGHASLTSRRVAEQIGVKQRLVYYYFHTMDDLVVETFRRLSRRELERLHKAAAAEYPLREIWEVCINTADARLVTEFMALATRIAPLAREVIDYIEASRRIEIEAIENAVRTSGNRPGIPVPALALIATSTALALTRERDLGVDLGHAEMRDAILGVMKTLEPGADWGGVQERVMGCRGN